MHLEKDYETKNADTLSATIERERQLTLFMEQLQEKELQIKESLSYRQRYLELFQKVLNVYTDWSTKISVFGVTESGDNRRHDDDGPLAEIRDPI
jgi:dynactin complex subunit